MRRIYPESCRRSCICLRAWTRPLAGSHTKLYESWRPASRAYHAMQVCYALSMLACQSNSCCFLQSFTDNVQTKSKYLTRSDLRCQINVSVALVSPCLYIRLLVGLDHFLLQTVTDPIVVNPLDTSEPFLRNLPTFLCPKRLYPPAIVLCRVNVAITERLLKHLVSGHVGSVPLSAQSLGAIGIRAVLFEPVALSPMW